MRWLDALREGSKTLPLVLALYDASPMRFGADPVKHLGTILAMFSGISLTVTRVFSGKQCYQESRAEGVGHGEGAMKREKILFERAWHGSTVPSTTTDHHW